MQRAHPHTPADMPAFLFLPADMPAFLFARADMPALRFAQADMPALRFAPATLPALRSVPQPPPLPRTIRWQLTALLLTALLLPGCSLLSKSDQSDTPSAVGGADAAATSDRFSLVVKAPDEVRGYLERNLEIQRYKRVPDLGAAELSRLMVAAEANARELLNTRGYFTPRLVLELTETPQERTPRRVTLSVEPGQQTRVSRVQIDFAGAVALDAGSQSQRDAIRNNWSLGEGRTFTQGDWDAAKSAGLRALSAKRYPTASIAASRAAIDADRSQASLSVNYRSGPAYRFGPVDLRGAERYSVDGALRIARVPVGQDYDQAKLLDAQQRLGSSGYYDSVFLTLDTDAGDPQNAPVIAQVREAPYQKVVLGAGFTSDSGPRLSADHIHNQMPLLGWRAVSRLSVDTKKQSLGTDWNAIPDWNGWRWFGSGLLQSEESGSYTVDSGRLRFGRGKNVDHIDRSLFLQYDYGRNRGTNAPPSAAALSANWSWTGRYFDDAAAPTKGQALGLEVGAGYLLEGPRQPFSRVYARWLGLLPLWTVRGDPEKDTQARAARLQFRAEGGLVRARNDGQIPATLLYLTGGDTTVRGYTYRSIGTQRSDGQIVAGRYLAVASMELQQPVVWNGRLSDFEGVAFVDVGAVADRPSDLDPKVGIGGGVRWRSPVGPVQADVGYGVAVRKLRLHVRLGFTF